MPDTAQVTLPEIGQEVSPMWALELAIYFFGEQHFIVKRIKKNLHLLESFTFDGLSVLDDELLAKLKAFGEPWNDAIICGLKHDIKYWAGLKESIWRRTWNILSRNKGVAFKERLKADLEFKLDLLNVGFSPEMANACFVAVRTLGIQSLKQKYSWGFGWIK